MSNSHVKAVVLTCVTQALLVLTMSACIDASSQRQPVAEQLTPVVLEDLPGPVPSPSSVQTPAAGSCHVHDGLPDQVCTPGVSNASITQANISSTICNRSWSTASIRPPVSYTETLKRRLMQSYGLSGDLAGYELDHLIPLEDGGHPWDVRNLWPESRSGSPNALDKDKVENAVHTRICSGALPLDQARQQLATDWTRLQSLLGAAQLSITITPEP
jgi:hypothetical protein